MDLIRKMKILFICKHNRLRSKVAEALFNKLNKNPKIKVKSAGTNLDKYRFVAPLVKKVLKKFGIKKIDNTPRSINSKLVKWADKIVIVADNIPKSTKLKEKI